MPYNVPINFNPYMYPIIPEVNGTVASHKDPITIENTTTDVGVIGNIINAIAAIVRPA